MMIANFSLQYISVLALAATMTLLAGLFNGAAEARPSELSYSPFRVENPLLRAESFQRFDLDETTLDEQKYILNPEAMLKTTRVVPNRNAYNAGLFATDNSMIAVEFVCMPPPWATTAHSETCAKVQRAFTGVFQHIEDNFELKRPIKVKFEYSSFCAYPQGAGNGLIKENETSETAQVPAAEFRFRNRETASKMQKPAECAATAEQLGLAAPAALWIPETPDPTTGLKYSYPQALVKQLMAESRSNINFNEHDIYARFNADQEDGLWFSEDGSAIRSSQYDFQYIVLHEFMHGLGMVSSWNMAFDGLQSTQGGPRGSQMLAPILSGGNKNDIVVMPQTATVFDKYISTTSKASGRPAFFNRYASAIMNAVSTLPRGSTLASFFKATIIDNSASEAAQLAFQAATTDGALQFSFPDGTSVLLHTEKNQYRPGTSIVHVNHAAYTGTTEFLMRPYANNGVTLQSLGKGRVFGPLTLKVFETMGYTVKQGGAASHQAFKRDFENDSASSSSASSNIATGTANWVREGGAAESSSAVSLMQGTSAGFGALCVAVAFANLI